VTVASVADLVVGDEVWCLASVGTPYAVESIDPEGGRVRLSARPALGAGTRPLDLPSDALWMVSKERWDQIWYWPDRAGERYDEVVARFTAVHQPGDVVQGYFLDASVGSAHQGFIAPNPKTAMSFEIQRPTPGFGQVRVKPVTVTSDEVTAVGPNVPLRVGMSCYRWSLSFGELVLNWEDFLRPDEA
jgi:hypothetical protein